MDRIKRLSNQVLDDHKSKFGVDFADNKKALDEISIVRSKGLKNEIAGYITKFIKKEIREEKDKQARIEASKSVQYEELSEIEQGLEPVAGDKTETIQDAEQTAGDTIEQQTDTLENKDEETASQPLATADKTETIQDAEQTATEQTAGDTIEQQTDTLENKDEDPTQQPFTTADEKTG